MTREEVVEEMVAALKQTLAAAGQSVICELPGCCVEDTRKVINAALSAASRAGWVMVPREPTDAMSRAGYNTGAVSSLVRADLAWSAMLSASGAIQ